MGTQKAQKGVREGLVLDAGAGALIGVRLGARSATDVADAHVVC
jgi:hypothetical protein